MAGHEGTRRVGTLSASPPDSLHLALGLSSALNGPIPETTFGVFRM